MYNPTHTRFGPYAAGALLACNVVIAQASTAKASSKKGGWSFVSLVLSAVALGNLAVPCMPAADEAPVEAQLFATAALRQLSAASMALLLYRALVSGHAWYSPVLRAGLSFRPLGLVGAVSYPSYLLHFRILEYLNFHGYAMPPGSCDLLRARGMDCVPAAEASEWVAYMIRLFAMGTFISLTVSAVFHLAVERPLIEIFRPKAKRG